MYKLKKTKKQKHWCLPCMFEMVFDSRILDIFLQWQILVYAPFHTMPISLHLPSKTLKHKHMKYMQFQLTFCSNLLSYANGSHYVHIWDFELQLIGVQVGLAMTTSTMMQMPLVDNMMSTCRQENWKKGGGRKWVCSRETWNPMFLTMEIKTTWTTLWDVVYSPPSNNKKGGSLQNLRVGCWHKCN
jgi:hypothetical protein